MHLTEVDSRVIVVGAGLAGTAAARRVAAAGVPVTVVDKAYVVGGRLATRALGTTRLDTGAARLDARSPALGLVRDALRDAGLVDATGAPGPRGVRATVEHLLAGLPVHKQARVLALEPRRRGWRLVIEGGAPLEASHVIVTAPAPQALALVAAAGLDAGPLAEVTYAPRFVLVLAWDAPVALPPRAPGFESLRGGPTQLVATADEETSRALLAIPEEAAADVLSVRLASALGGALPPCARSLKRWRYARVTAALDGIDHLAVAPTLFVAGDAFRPLTPPATELDCAFASGTAAAAALLQMR